MSLIVITNEHGEEVRSYSSGDKVAVSVKTLTGYDTIGIAPKDARALAAALLNAADRADAERIHRDNLEADQRYRDEHGR